MSQLESKGKCSFVGSKIFANTQYLSQNVNICITTKCGFTKVKKSDSSKSVPLPVVPSKTKPEQKEKVTNKIRKKTELSSKELKTPKIKFHPLTCGNDTSCISRDLSRCKEHNENPNAEVFDCKNHYSNLEVFTPVKVTLDFLTNEGGLSGLNSKIKQAMQSCESSHSNAELCCGDSMSCGMGGEPGQNAQHLKTITNMTQIINSAGGLPEKCRALKNITRAGTVGVMAFSTNCYTAVNKCHKSCKPYMQVVQEIEGKLFQAECQLKNQLTKSEMNYLFGSRLDSYNDFCILISKDKIYLAAEYEKLDVNQLNDQSFLVAYQPTLVSGLKNRDVKISERMISLNKEGHVLKNKNKIIQSNDDLILHHADAAKGASGGGLFCKNGKLIGLSVSQGALYSDKKIQRGYKISTHQL